MTQRLQGKVALVTGAARGMGRAAAIKFAQEGARVIACDLGEQIPGIPYANGNSADLEETVALVREAGSDAIAQVADVRDQDQLDAAVTSGIDAFGQIDVAVANAGIVHYGDVWSLTEDEWNLTLDINTNGVWRTAKAVAPHMIERLTGSIIVTSSINGHVAMKRMAHYVTSKHAVLGLMKSLAFELGPYNIRVNAILPGAIHTPMTDNSYQGEYTTGNPDTKWDDRVEGLRPLNLLRGRTALPASAIADAMCFFASEEAAHVTGVELPVDAGHLILPGVNLDPVRETEGAAR
ncbi:mycofactocin-coupled SDR family oxidoreductase [Rhodococcus jostii]|uniref:Mycofactocin-coupled SDR family oxidoreductase n=1 Tax=Rhodococcus jostii TaxID=132919 RepID=A0ABU4CTU5_RHOJO|nr:mycofactocin-coupled SDR family oxidoreductase [Rhodococcus jostii]MDV6286980.1 mycofactocin-coupled SDR family oxidoreductase [Rhodococcus jostii]